jgi:DNA-binding beta-propeller fold protein YncE
MRILTVSAIVLAGAALIAKEAGVFPALQTQAALGKLAAGLYLVPTNQMLHPWGEQTIIPGRPVDMTYDSQKRILAVLNWREVLLLDGSTGAKLAAVPSKSTSYTGIAFRPGNRELWTSETTRNGPDSILVIRLSDVGLPVSHDLPCLRVDHRQRIIPAEHHVDLLPVARERDPRRHRMALQFETVVQEVEVGIAPFSVAVAPSRGRIYVSNRGGRRPTAKDTTAPSSGTAVATDPVTGSTTTGTLSVVDPETWSAREVATGLAPSHMALSADEKLLAVANSHSDTVTIVETDRGTTTEVRIPAFPEAALGSQPVSTLFTPDGKTLYVACGGNNAIAAVRRSGSGWKVAGALPTAWFPSAIALDAEGGLRILNIKGIGNTDNKKGGFNSRQYEGSLERIPAPTPLQLESGAREVKAANMPVYEPAGGVSNLSSLGIQHVFLIVKENRTYDQIFGDMGKGNGDPKLAIYGKETTPNHHALADKYVLLDNFYTGGAISFDGHQWLMQAFVSDYVERAFAASPRGYAYNMSDALVVAPTGFFWQNSVKPLSVRLYGELQLPADWDSVRQSAIDMTEDAVLSWSEYFRLYREGKWQEAVGARASVPALQPYSSQRYPFQSLNIPDQLRAEEFLREFAEFEKNGGLPNLCILSLNSDHTNGTRPGSPTPKAMVADNDLALGRIVEGISKSRYWPNSLILVVEDDAQDGVDHVDGHRTVAMAIGPKIRRGAVDSNNYNQVSLVRTIQEIFRVPQRTRYLAAARAMTSVFTKDADPSPYQRIVPKQDLEEKNPPLKALAGRQLWAARESLKMNFADIDDVPKDILNRILWWDAKGYDVPYPSVRKR